MTENTELEEKVTGLQVRRDSGGAFFVFLFGTKLALNEYLLSK